MKVSAALLDFPCAALADVFTDCLSDVSGSATRLCDLPENTAWKRRYLTFYALSSQTNNHEKTTVVIAILGY